MDFNITAEEEALVLRIDERLRAGDTPTEEDLLVELGDEVRAQVQSLVRKGWLGAGQSLELSDLARRALANRHDAGGFLE
ncbi:hypothetical protein [Streptomyces monomycini]|uniref:hypothetical protein n=1 Tax=Streptomyces monomycini TaxID=371720 RepID=UPI000997657E|nr:hypothetical protein [Streptomyces monomycini]